MDIALPTVSQKLAVLEKQQLIERRTCREDRRKTMVTVTDKGREMVQDEYQKMIDSLYLVCEKLGEEKTAILTELLDEISGYMDTEIHREGEKDETH